MPDPSVPVGFDDPSIPFDDVFTGFDGNPGPPPLPIVTDVTPSSGPDSGGTTVIITGTGLDDALTVLFGGVAAAIVTNTPTTVVVTTPGHLAGTVPVVVTTVVGTSTPDVDSQYTYTSTSGPATPTITKLQPAAGPVSGGSIVTITGTELGFAFAVFFGDTPAAEFSIDSDTQITARTPPHEKGPVPVTITNASGTSGVTPACIYTFFPPRPPKTRRWVILARDGNNRPQAEVSDYTALTFIERDKDVGSFIATVPVDSPFVPALLAPRAGIIVLADDEEVFSGPIRNRLRTNHGGLKSLQISGADDNFWLAARIASREPHTDAPPYNHSLADTRTGVCSTVLSAYVEVNVGIGALSRRRIPALTIGPDLGLGSTVTGKAVNQILLVLLRNLCFASTPEVSFRIRQSGQALVFDTFLPRDLVGSVVFSSGSGTLGDFEYEQAGSNSNYLYAAGNGSGTDRLFVEGENGADITEWGLVERILSRSDLDTEPELQQAISAELVAQTGVFRTDLQVIDTAGLQWRVDYQTGDHVSVDVDGVRLHELIRETKVELGPDDAETVTPSVSSPNAKTTVREQALFSLVRDLQTRISNLERGQ